LHIEKTGNITEIEWFPPSFGFPCGWIYVIHSNGRQLIGDQSNEKEKQSSYEGQHSPNTYPMAHNQERDTPGDSKQDTKKSYRQEYPQWIEQHCNIQNFYQRIECGSGSDFAFSGSPLVYPDWDFQHIILLVYKE
jgi:hypothetical protein